MKTSAIVLLIVILLIGVAAIAAGAILWLKVSPGELAGSEKTVVAVGKQAPEITITTLDGKQLSLSDFRGNPVMFWLIATWCPTCQVGAKVLSEEKMSEIEKYDLKIVVVKIWNNLGYSGPSLEEFGREWVGENFDHPNWIWGGELSKEDSFLYDPRGFPDIYYLIDRNGIIRAIDTAPSATINKIFNFAASQ